jgi:hypothetical protein
MAASHTKTPKDDWQGIDPIQEECHDYSGECYIGLAIGLPMSLAIWAALIALVYKLFL